jgi:hypothetical protein
MAPRSISSATRRRSMYGDIPALRIEPSSYRRDGFGKPFKVLSFLIT